MTALPWQVETLRLTFLNLSNEQAEQEFGWSTITSAEPDSVTSKPAIGLVTEEGEWLQGNLSVAKQVGRLDIVYSYKRDSTTILPNAGSFVECMQSFESIFNAAREIRASRVGFGGVLLLPVDSGRDGYVYLQKFLPFISLADDMSEVALQVNRKKESSLGLKINQLSKWGCVALKRFVMAGDAFSAELLDLNAVRLEFDINTADQHEQVSSCQMSELLHELSDRAHFVSENGAI